MTRCCLISSSEMYPVYWKDIQNLPCMNSNKVADKQEIIIILGNNQYVQQDCFLYDYTLLFQKEKYQENSLIWVRFCFPTTCSFQSILNLMKIYRCKNKRWSSRVYQVPCSDLRNMGIERCVRTSENAYLLKRYPLNKQQRDKKYDQLKESLKKGYDSQKPISVMLCRHWGLKDSLDDGHHRLSACIDGGVETVFVRFCYASSVKIFTPFGKGKQWLES